MAVHTEPLNFKVSKPLKKRIQFYATANGLTLASAVRLLITASLNREGVPEK